MISIRRPQSFEEMMNPDALMLDDAESIPDGFWVNRSGEGDLVIHHKRAGGCLNVFLFIWLVAWTFGCVFLAIAFFGGGKMDGGKPMPWWFVSAFWAAEFFAAGLLAYLIFCRKTYLIGPEELAVTTTVGRYRRTQMIQKAHVRRLIQVQDGGKGDDSFPTWGLEIQTTIRKTTLIFRQPHEQSLWLGNILAKWARVDFITLPEE